MAGFWSKDEILLDAWRDNRGLWFVAQLVSFLTAFYMFRAIFLTFFGEYKGGQPVDPHDHDSHFEGDPAHPHESPWSMAAPLIILAVPAIGAGIFAYDHMFRDFIEGALPEIHEHHSAFEWNIASMSTIFGILGIAAAWAISERKWVDSRSFAMGFGPITNLFENKWYFDKIYEDLLITRVLQNGWNRLLELNDRYVVDGAVNGSGKVARFASDRLRTIQNGQPQAYGLGFAAGILVVVIAVFAANPL
jgi:NADH:ubiquinone oxidoreductase subunit 5 (subunit L)/multisubunit Na+/H+ antiporter MnhA subunit